MPRCNAAIAAGDHSRNAGAWTRNRLAAAARNAAEFMMPSQHSAAVSGPAGTKPANSAKVSTGKEAVRRSCDEGWLQYQNHATRCEPAKAMKRRPVQPRLVPAQTAPALTAARYPKTRLWPELTERSNRVPTSAA